MLFLAHRQPEAANAFQQPCQPIVTVQPFPLVIKLSVPSPHFIAWCNRNAAYLSAVYLGALPPREAPVISKVLPMTVPVPSTESSLWSFCVGCSDPCAAAPGSPGGGLVGGGEGFWRAVRGSARVLAVAGDWSGFAEDWLFQCAVGGCGALNLGRRAGTDGAPRRCRRVTQRRNLPPRTRSGSRLCSADGVASPSKSLLPPYDESRYWQAR